jgi:hypothetical protein
MTQAFDEGLKSGENIGNMANVFAQQNLQQAQAIQGVADINAEKASLAAFVNQPSTNPSPGAPAAPTGFTDPSTGTPTPSAGTPAQGTPPTVPTGSQPSLPLQDKGSTPAAQQQQPKTPAGFSQDKPEQPSVDLTPPRNNEGMYRQAAQIAAKMGSPKVFEHYSQLAEIAKGNYRADVQDYMNRTSQGIEEVARTVDAAQNEQDIFSALDRIQGGDPNKIKQLKMAVLMAPDLAAKKQVVKNITMSVKDQMELATNRMKAEDAARKNEILSEFDRAKASAAETNATANMIKAKAEALKAQKYTGGRGTSATGGSKGFTIQQAIAERDKVHSQYMSQYNKLMSEYNSMKADSQYKTDVANQIKRLTDSYNNYKEQMQEDWRRNGLNVAPTSTKSNSSQFEEGKVYIDANGNKAKYENGKWVAVQ